MKSNPVVLLALVGALFGFCAIPASAQIVELTATGNIYSLSSFSINPNPTVSVGTLIHFSTKLDLSKPASQLGTTPENGVYGEWGTFDTRFSFGNVSVDGGVDVQRFNAWYFPNYSVYSTSAAVSGSSGAAAGFSIFLGPVIPDFNTPLDPERLLHNFQFSMFVSESGQTHSYGAWALGVDFSLRAVPLTPVPEPSVYGLFAAGCSVAFVILRRVTGNT